MSYKMNFGKVVKFSSLSEQDQNVANRAIEVKANAYFPYSKFKVGAAVISGSGVIYKGCSVDNAAYSLSVCAERSAIVNAISEGETSIQSIAIVSDKEGYCPPCGNCRQVIYEFGQESDCKILLVNNPTNSDCLQTSIRELLQCGFGPADLHAPS